MSSTSVDKDTIESLRELMEDEFDELVENYLEDTQILLDEIEAAVRDEDVDALQKRAHAMKSSSANMGAIAMSELARELEARGRSGDTSDARSLLDRAIAEFARVREALAAELQSS